ncbi:hypothetical protein AWH56_011885 [Anaerobacillus isosaccharinicus]|uniref:Uncharacterized protein n=1 Tax=Anaerobacillus isosaccharinicus TaxID=1532552 RepID=A0A7S7LBU7_9BACI|nr:hypothetical protein [Anaerobacillus isosaccharinicus]MBA5588401.1 hypothetical protein [Anaerobacillus isosaccharinicus]QOY38168.1 hypothetical protein AWH56_011885 [Anaerobacillus isosaccharinicus]
MDIGIIGELPNQSFDKVTFHKTEPASLELEEFDAEPRQILSKLKYRVGFTI